MFTLVTVVAVLVTVGFCVVALATVSNENVTEYTSSESQSLGLLHENEWLLGRSLQSLTNYTPVPENQRSLGRSEAPWR